jgi:uncharacterized membrane protein (UPF0127 family)
MNRFSAGLLIGIIVLSIFVGYQALRPTIKASRIEIAGVTLTVELAETSGDQQKGLSGRSSLSPDHGMLFVFSQEGLWSFWMHDMMFPLDIIWFNSSRQAVFMAVRLQPCTPELCPIYTPTAPAMYVLEVNANFVQEHNIMFGTAFAFVS